MLIDETDKADVEIEGLLLEVLSDFAITIPEMGTVEAKTKPFVVLTSNSTRELTEALRRRCLYLHIDFPTPELERSIVLEHVPNLNDVLLDSIIRIIGALRDMPVRKAPSVAETIDWAKTLIALGAETIDDYILAETLCVVLKHRDDVARALKNLDVENVLGRS
mgnify:CR=1 FL=1